jgi:photosystem II stability/assembly factor-like uncharacterized protein
LSEDFGLARFLSRVKTAIALTVRLGLALLLPAAFRIRAAETQFPEKLFQELQWRMIGPFRGGRTRAASGVASQPNVFYVGHADGGVWKTDDYGRTWKPLFDSQPVQSIGAIAVAASDPRVLYVSTGEGLERPDLAIGNGIYKSSDGGETWTYLGLEDSQQIPSLAVDPEDPNHVYAAVLGHPYGPNAERGVFRSTDGGKTWAKTLYKDENTGACQVELDPSNPRVVYASLWRARQAPWEDHNAYGGAGGGIFKSTDGGDTWRQLTNGLPEALLQAFIAIAPSNPKRLYAMAASAGEKEVYGRGRGIQLYRSDDAGESWRQTGPDERPTARIGGGDLPVPKVDPKDPDTIYSTSIVTWRSRDAGQTWKAIRGAPGGDDYQNIWINPANPETMLLVGDQGALVTVNGGATWSSWYNQPTAQLYHVITDHQFPYRIYAAQQESGSVGLASRGNDGEITVREWHPVGAIEYGYVAPDPLNANIVYGAGRTEVSRFDWITGQRQNVTPVPVKSDQVRADRTEPILFSPIDPHLLYYAANFIYQTVDGGQSWRTISPDLTRQHPGIPSSVGQLAGDDPYAAKVRGTIYALAPSFQTTNTVWAGTDDGLVWLTRDAGEHWTNMTPPELTPWSKVTQLSASHFDDNTAYLSVSRFRIDDLRPCILRTHDGGKSWQTIVQGLPADAPVNTVREDPIRPGLLYAGTQKAVWVSFDDGAQWQPLQLNLPHTSMRDLWIHDHDLIVATHGRSLWVLDDITPLRQLTPAFAKSEVALCRPAVAWRVKRDTNSDTPLPPDEPAGKNPSEGAVIDYYLARPAQGPVTLEILDPDGTVVRRYSSNDPAGPGDEELSKLASIPLYWIRRNKVIPATSGMHRWIWDLHYATPISTHREYPIAAVPHDTPHLPLGPTARPGQYTVRLSAEGHVELQPLEVKMDPRVKTSLADLERQFQAEQRLAAMLAQSSEAVGLARSVQNQASKIASEKKAANASDAESLVKKVTNLLEGAGGGDESEAALSDLNDQVSSLYGQVQTADAAPTSAQSSAIPRLEQALAERLADWKHILEIDVPAFNTRSRASAGPEILPEWNPATQPDSENEE